MELDEYKDALVAVLLGKGFQFVNDTERLAGAALDASNPYDMSGPLRRGDNPTKSDGTAGLTDTINKIVYVRDDISTHDQVLVIGHELSHVVLHGQIRSVRDLQFIDAMMFLMLGAQALYAQNEIEAEMTSYAVASQYGYGDKNWSTEYITGYKSFLGDYFTEELSMKRSASAALAIVQEINNRNAALSRV